MDRPASNAFIGSVRSGEWYTLPFQLQPLDVIGDHLHESMVPVGASQLGELPMNLITHLIAVGAGPTLLVRTSAIDGRSVLERPLSPAISRHADLEEESCRAEIAIAALDPRVSFVRTNQITRLRVQPALTRCGGQGVLAATILVKPSANSSSVLRSSLSIKSWTVAISGSSKTWPAIRFGIFRIASR
jgi:hypothetical protein